jgi:hypothetical protein
MVETASDAQKQKIVPAAWKILIIAKVHKNDRVVWTVFV